MNDTPGSRNPRASRRRVLQTVSGLTTLGVLGAGSSTTVAADPGDQRWRFETDDVVGSSPTVVDGTVFVGSYDNNVYALSATDGIEQWQPFVIGNRIPSSPSVVNNTLVIGNGISVYGHDARSGTEQWHFDRADFSVGGSNPGDIGMWLPDPRQVDPDLDHYMFESFSPAVQAPAEYDRVSDPEDGLDPRFDSISIGDTETVISVTKGNYSFDLYFGSFDVSRIEDELENTEYDPVRSTNELAIYTRENTEAVGVSSEVFIETIDDSDDPNAGGLVELLFDTENGEVTRYTEALSDMQVLMNTLPSGHIVEGETFARVENNAPSSGVFERQVAEGRVESFDRRVVDRTEVLVFLGEGDIVARDIEEYIEESGQFSEFLSRPNYEIDGRTVTITGQEPYSRQSEIKNRRESSPTMAGETVFFGSRDYSVYALDADGRREQWRFQTADAVTASPTIANGSVFIGSYDNNLYALHTGDGSERWRFETGGDIGSSPTVANGTVFVGSADNEVYALDDAGGTQQWSFGTNDAVWSSPTAFDNTVFVGSDDANVYALDADDGTEEWRFETGGRVRSSPTVATHTVFVGSDDGNVYALDADDGTEEWRFETGGRVRSSPIVVDGTVFVGSADNHVYALDAGIEGSSEGSRVALGTLNHHHEFTVYSENEETTSADDSPGYEGNDVESTDEFIPGFGVGSTLAGIGGAGYLLHDRISNSERDD